jgi:hypothetical protein
MMVRASDMRDNAIVFEWIGMPLSPGTPAPPCRLIGTVEGSARL